MNNLKISYLGPKGSYSEKAAKLVAEEGTELIPLQPIDEVIRSLKSGEADISVVPYYNSIAGYVQTHLDLLYQNELKIIGVKRVPIELCIGGYPDKVKEIYSHPKAFEQCSKYIRQNYPKTSLLEVASTAEAAKKIRENNVIRIIPRVNNEDDYQTPSHVNELRQIKYNSLPFNIFYIDVDEEVIELFEKAPKLEEFLIGFIGMHTHDNRKYIAAIEGTELAEVFKNRNMKSNDSSIKFKIIEKKVFETGKWKPYLKRGGADQYYRPIMEALDWSEESIKIYDIPKNVPFEEEGIIISGVSSRLAARYMPCGCYWDSNKAIGFIKKKKSISITYMLGLLNSSLYNYLAKGIINNTSSIQITGVHALPFIEPENEIKEKVEIIVKSIIKNKEKNLKYDYNKEQKVIDDVIFSFYAQKFKFPNNLKQKLDNEYSIYGY